MEEPVCVIDDLAAFHAGCNLPVALDESLDDIIRAEPACSHGRMPARLCSLLQGHGVTAVVIKPAVVGGVEKSLMIARWAHSAGVQVQAV